MTLTSTVRRTTKRLLDRSIGPVVGSVLRVDTHRPQVVLTFDDGPDAMGTPAVLSALREHRATATFFVLLNQLPANGALLDEVMSEGHEIALHGLDHRRLTRLPPRDVRGNLRRARQELEDRIGLAVRHFRPPYGAQSPLTYAVARAESLDVVLWGPSTWDWRDVDQDVRVRRATERISSGDIVLAHDGFADDAGNLGGGPDCDKADLINRVLENWSAQGLNAVSLRRSLVDGRVRRGVRFGR